MIPGLIYVVLPLAIYFGLALRPPGRGFLFGFALVGTALALLWSGYAGSLGPFFTGDAQADAFAVAALMLYTAVWVLAGVVQALGRVMSRPMPGLPYWAVAIFFFVLLAVPGLFVLGV